MVKDITLKKNTEFKRAYRKGQTYVSKLMVSYIIRNRKNCLRIGVTASKKTGNAVRRNRSRRVIISAFREISGSIKPGYDIVFVARAGTADAKSTDILKVMKKHLLDAGLIEE